MKKDKYFFPLVIAFYPALSLFAKNITQVALADTIRSFVVSMLIAIFIFALAYVIYRDSLRAAILTTIVLFLLFSYGHIYQLSKSVWILGFHIGRHRYLLAIWLLVVLFSVLWLRKPKPSLTSFGKVLNVTSIILILIPVFLILSFEWSTVNLDVLEPSTPNTDEQGLIADIRNTQISESSTLHDVYYIILDMYTRQDVLSEMFGFDNSPFVNRLEQLGFYVASCSQSNYDSTVLSLGSSLNMEYFQVLLGEDYNERLNPYSFGNIVKNNRVRKYLENLGYDIIALESGFSPTEWGESDSYRAPNKDLMDLAFGSLNPFEAMFLRTTPGVLFYGYFDRLPDTLRTGLDSAYIQHRERILFALEEIIAISEEPGPKFVFVHILAPHNPFVFGPNGEFIRRDTLFTLNADLESDTWDEFSTGYVGQVTYLNKRLLEIVTHILSNSDTAPVIIIQGDHGIPKLEDAVGKVAIFNTYYFPGDGDDMLYSNISPVNTFRLLFDEYFGTNYGLLDDISYFVPSKKTPLAFETVPNSEGSCLPAE